VDFRLAAVVGVVLATVVSFAPVQPLEKYPFRFAEDSRGNWYREHGDLDRAVRDYEVLVRGVDESGSYVNMGNVHGARGDELLRQHRPGEASLEYAQALDMYSRAIERGGNPFESHLDRAITYAAIGRPRARARRLPAALDPDAPRLRASIAYEELALGRFDDCIADASAILATTPNDALAHFLRGVALVRTGRIPEGRVDLERAVSLDAGLGAAWYELSVLYRDAGDRRAALDAARRARDAGHPVADAYLDDLTRGG